MNNRRTPYLNELKSRATRKWHGLLGLFAACLLIVTGDYYSYPSMTRADLPFFNRGQNGVWLTPEWAQGKHSADEVKRLADHLQNSQVRYAYVALSVKRNPLEREKLARTASEFLTAMRSRAPRIQVIAWLPVSGELGERRAEFSSYSGRTTLVGIADWWLKHAQTDGVMWEARPSRDGDENLVSLVTLSKKSLPNSAIVGVAGAPWMPTPYTGESWSEGYYSRLSATADQIALVAAPQALLLPRGYVWLVKQQAILVPRAVAAGSSHSQVLIGMPRITQDKRSSTERRREVALALIGVREGLDSPESNADPFVGVVLNGDDLLDPDVQQAMNDMWINTPVRAAAAR